MIKKTYTKLNTPEENGKILGWFRVVLTIFGGLILSYLFMTLLAFILPLKIQESTIISIMFNTLAWAYATTWIALSYTKLIALLRFLIPTTICAIALYILY